MVEDGTVLQNRYRIDKQIGQGGMGTVFIATDQRFGSVVAVKKTFFDDENLNKAFEREARLLNGLKHPALPKVSDYFVEETGHFIVMEFIAGEDLFETMEKRVEPFRLDAVLNWADQLCEALNYLHNQEMPVIHRDIKPQNLKLTPDGQVILLDFGLAKGNPTDASHKTAAKSIFGYSRNYASLEQIQGTGTNPQSDLYSLAATLYHLMTGVPPADALTRAMDVLNGKPDPLVPANFVNNAVPNGVAEVIQSSMALNAAERPASASEMKAQFVNSDKTIGGSPDGNDYSTELMSQKTGIMTQVTNLTLESPMEMKTEVLIDNTKALRVKPIRPNSSRRYSIVGASLIVAMLSIAGLSFYFYRTFGSQNGQNNETPEVQQQQLSGGTENRSGNENLQAEIVNSEISGTPDPDSQVQPNGEQTSKTGGTVDVPKQPDPTASERPGTTVGNAPNDRQTKTNDTTVVDREIKPPSREPPPGKRPIPPLTPEEFRKLTPRQRIRYREMMLEQERLRTVQRPPQ